MKKVLFKNGYVVSMDEKIGNVKNCDVLVENDRISKVGKDLFDPEAEVIDASDCIVMPGFVDTHRHTWQTQLRTVAADWTLYDYLVHMRVAYGSFYNPHDAYLGNYAGALDSINNGVTTIVDHCHLCNSPEHVDNLVNGLDDSGIRALWTYGWYVNPKYDPDFSMEPSPGWRYDDAKRVRQERLYDDNARVIFGVNPSEYSVSSLEVLEKELKIARDLGANVISCHVGMAGYSATDGNLKILGEKGLMGPDMLFVHCSGFDDEIYRYVKETGAGISSTPEVDLQMGMGHPPVIKAHKLGIRTGIGLDITSNYSAEMFTQMRVSLADQRGLENDFIYDKYNIAPGKLYTEARTALYLATMGGARAIHKEDCIGSLTPGKKADIQMIRCDAPNMTPLGNVEHAIIYYANVGNIDTVMVDGQIRKKDGKLVGVDWKKIREEMEESAANIKQKADAIFGNPEVCAGAMAAHFPPEFKVYLGELK